MELSLRLDTLGVIEFNYLRLRERYRDWPAFRLIAASRQARILAYMPYDVAEQLHQQILTIETTIGLDIEVDEEEEVETVNGIRTEEGESEEVAKPTEKESSAFSPAFAQALKQLNELARQRLPEAGTTTNETGSELNEEDYSEEDALEQLQDAFIQMMEIVRELAEEMSTDALKMTGRFKCARTKIELVPKLDDEDDGNDEIDEELELEDVERTTIVELMMVLQLFEEGRTRSEDEPTVELQMDVDDFERLHETLDLALAQEQRNRRRRS